MGGVIPLADLPVAWAGAGCSVGIQMIIQVIKLSGGFALEQVSSGGI